MVDGLGWRWKRGGGERTWVEKKQVKFLVGLGSRGKKQGLGLILANRRCQQGLTQHSDLWLAMIFRKIHGKLRLLLLQYSLSLFLCVAVSVTWSESVQPPSSAAAAANFRACSDLRAELCVCIPRAKWRLWFE